MWLKDEAAAKGWFLAIVRREYPRTFERKRFITVDVDDFLTREGGLRGYQLKGLTVAMNRRVIRSCLM